MHCRQFIELLGIKMHLVVIVLEFAGSEELTKNVHEHINMS
jgi:hypothetical protein